MDAFSCLSHTTDPLKKINPIDINAIESNKKRLQALKDAQRRDILFSQILDYLEKGNLPESLKAANKILAEAKYMEVEDGILYHIWAPQDRRLKEEVRRQITLPTEWKVIALCECHDSNLTGGHFGFTKTYEKVRERYWWPNCYTDTKNWVETCNECAKHKGAKPEFAGKINPIIAKEAWDIVGTDVFGPLPETDSGNTAVLVFIDHFTKYIILLALKCINEEETAQNLIERVICQHGVMRQLTSDRGANFVSQVISEVYKLFKIHKVNTIA